MNPNPDKKPSYIKKLLSFYFARRWQSLIAVFYFAIFGYFAIFYLGNLWLSLKFITYTLLNSAQLLGLPYLFWGVAFLVALLVPFSASMYALILLYEILGGEWKRSHKIAGAIVLVVAALSIIISADEVIRLVAEQDELAEFIAREELEVGGR